MTDTITQPVSRFVEPPPGTIRHSEQLSEDRRDTMITFGLSRFRVGQTGLLAPTFSGSVAIYAPNKLRACIANEQPTAQQLNEIGQTALRLLVKESGQLFVDRSSNLIEKFSMEIRLVISSDLMPLLASAEDDHDTVTRKLLLDLGIYVEQSTNSRPRLEQEFTGLIERLHQLEVVELDLDHGFGPNGRYWPVRQMVSEMQAKAA